MENWGLIVYEASLLNTNMGESSIIAHEMSHQWFGNIVSPEWWNDLWLSEGFAQFFQSVVIDEVRMVTKKCSLNF